MSIESTPHISVNLQAAVDITSESIAQLSIEQFLPPRIGILLIFTTSYIVKSDELF
jgi:hypothetical protein